MIRAEHPTFEPRESDPHKTAAFAAIAIVTLWRVFCLAYNRVEIFVDESQYWFWGQELAFGYYSKPPLVGWIIRLFNEIGQSDAVFWIRLPAQIAHGVTGWLVAMIARAIWEERSAVWAGVVYVTLPGVSTLALFVSTDDFMLTSFALALLALLRLNGSPSVAWALVFGGAIGFGLLAKYAMLFAAILVLGLRASSKLVISWRDICIAYGLASAIVFPNLIWNVKNGFVTFYHTVDNADWQGIAWNWSGLAEFVGTQILGFGIIFGPSYLAAVAFACKARPTHSLLVWLSLPIFLTISIQAVVKTANGNWAALAFVAGTILVSGWLLKVSPRIFFVGLVLNALIAFALPLTTIWPDKFTFRGRLVYDRAQKLSGLSDQAFTLARELKVTTLIAHDRAILANLVFHSKNSGLEVYAFPNEGSLRHHYELIRPLSDQVDVALFVGDRLPPSCVSEKLQPSIPLTRPSENRDTSFFLISKRCWSSSGNS